MDDRRQENTVRVKLHIAAEELNAESPSLPVGEGSTDVRATERLGRCSGSFRLIQRAPPDDYLTLGVREIPRCFRSVREEEPAEDSKTEAWKAFDNE